MDFPCLSFASVSLAVKMALRFSFLAWRSAIRMISVSGVNFPLKSTIAPWMTTANSFSREKTSARNAVFLQRFDSVGRTTRLEPALPQRPEQKSFRRRQRPAIQPHCKNQNVPNWIHSFKSPALLSAAIKSFSTSLNFFPAIEGRATSTRSTGFRKSF